MYFVHPHEKTRLVKLPSSSSSDGAHQIHQAQQAVRCHCVLRDAVKRRRAEPADCAVLTVHRYCERARKRAEFNSYQRPHHVSNAACIDSLYTDRCVFGSLSCRARLGARMRRHAMPRADVPCRLFLRLRLVLALTCAAPLRPCQYAPLAAGRAARVDWWPPLVLCATRFSIDPCVRDLHSRHPALRIECVPVRRA